MGQYVMYITDHNNGLLNKYLSCRMECRRFFLPSAHSNNIETLNGSFFGQSVSPISLEKIYH